MYERYLEWPKRSKLQKFLQRINIRKSIYLYKLKISKYPRSRRRGLQTTLSYAAAISQFRTYTIQRAALRHVPANTGGEEIRTPTALQCLDGMWLSETRRNFVKSIVFQLDSADEQAAAIRRELDGRMQRVAEMEKVFARRKCREGVVVLVV